VAGPVELGEPRETMINDDNTLEDIAGAIWSLQGDLCETHPDFPLPPQFDQIIERIELKLSRTRNPTLKNWFRTALEHAIAARSLFAQEQPDAAGQSLSKAWEYLAQGNKAHRRKTDFIVGPDGTASPTSEPLQNHPENQPPGD
jgi:hypothetical protein